MAGLVLAEETALETARRMRPILKEMPRLTATIIDVGSVEAGGKVQSDMLSMEDVKMMAVTISVAYDPSATAGVEVRLYSSPDGIAVDTDPFTTFAPTFTPGQTKQKTVLIDPSVNYLLVEIANLDETYPTGAVKVWVTKVLEA